MLLSECNASVLSQVHDIHLRNIVTRTSDYYSLLCKSDSAPMLNKAKILTETVELLLPTWSYHMSTFFFFSWTPSPASLRAVFSSVTGPSSWQIVQQPDLYIPDLYRYKLMQKNPTGLHHTSTTELMWWHIERLRYVSSKTCHLNECCYWFSVIHLLYYQYLEWVKMLFQSSLLSSHLRVDRPRVE